MKKGHILITGGSGYIGSHVLIRVLELGFLPVVVDDLSASDVKVVSRVEKICSQEIPFYKTDITDRRSLKSIFRTYDFKAVLHFAGKKSIGESCEQPLLYFRNNVVGTINILQCMEEFKVHNLVFSSSAAVYGPSNKLPIGEEDGLGALSPYGRSKKMVEDICRDVIEPFSSFKTRSFRIALLRYFNPVGAHESGLIGEAPLGAPDNLFPYVAGVASGRFKKVNVFGKDYPTVDGTGVRDYVHVMDLADGHVAALNWLFCIDQGQSICRPFNLGSGCGYSVMQIIREFERVSGKVLPYQFVQRRPGDVARCFADVKRAEVELSWRAKRELDQMVVDAWRWEQSR